MEQNKWLLLKYLLSSINLDSAAPSFPDTEQLRTQIKTLIGEVLIIPGVIPVWERGEGKDLHFWVCTSGSRSAAASSSRPLWEEGRDGMRARPGHAPSISRRPGRELLPGPIPHPQLAPGCCSTACKGSPTSGFSTVLLLIPGVERWAGKLRSL